MFVTISALSGVSLSALASAIGGLLAAILPLFL